METVGLFSPPVGVVFRLWRVALCLYWENEAKAMGVPGWFLQLSPPAPKRISPLHASSRYEAWWKGYSTGCDHDRAGFLGWNVPEECEEWFSDELAACGERWGRWSYQLHQSQSALSLEEIVGLKIIQDILNEQRYLLDCFSTPSFYHKDHLEFLRHRGADSDLGLQAKCLYFGGRWIVTPLVQWWKCNYLIGQFECLTVGF